MFLVILLEFIFLVDFGVDWTQYPARLICDCD